MLLRACEQLGLVAIIRRKNGFQKSRFISINLKVNHFFQSRILFAVDLLYYKAGELSKGSCLAKQSTLR